MSLAICFRRGGSRQEMGQRILLVVAQLTPPTPPPAHGVATLRGARFVDHHSPVDLSVWLCRRRTGARKPPVQGKADEREAEEGVSPALAGGTAHRAAAVDAT